MSDFTDNVRRAFELYLFGNKKEAFNFLIPGSKYHTYLTLLDSLQSEKTHVSKDTVKKIEDFYNSLGGSDADKLKMRALFQQYDGAKKKEKESILQNIIFYLGVSPNHTKPMDLVRKSAKHEEKKLNLGKGVYDTMFDTNMMVKNVEANAYANVSQLHQTLQNEVDFNKITDDAFFQFTRSGANLAEMTNKSFLNKLATALDQRYKNNSYYQFDFYI
jgi:hypothetical protein